MTLATFGQAAPGLALFGGWLAFTAFLVRRMQRVARGQKWTTRVGIHAGQLALLFLGLYALFAFLLYLNAWTCPAGIEGGVLDSITDCP